MTDGAGYRGTRSDRLHVGGEPRRQLADVSLYSTDAGARRPDVHERQLFAFASNELYRIRVTPTRPRAGLYDERPRAGSYDFEHGP